MKLHYSLAAPVTSFCSPIIKTFSSVLSKDEISRVFTCDQSFQLLSFSLEVLVVQKI
jgi:hypothetical protein